MLPPLTAWFFVGLAGGSYVTLFPTVVFCLLVLGACAIAWCERHHAFSCLSGSAAYAALLAGVVYWPMHALAFTPIPAPVPMDSSPSHVTGRIVAPVRVAPHRLLAVVEPLDRPHTGGSPTVPTRIRLTWRAPDRLLREGDLIAFSSRLHVPSGTRNPGAFDFSDYLRRQGIDAVGTVSGSEGIRVVQSGTSSWRWALWTHLDEWRHRISQAASRSLSTPMAGVYVGLVTGDQGLIDADVREDFVATGTVHILSISGSHLGLIALLAFASVRLACHWMPTGALLRLSHRGLTPTRLAALITAPLVTAYALLAGAEVATLRALSMILLCLAAVWLGRRRFLCPILSAAALMTVLINPPVLYDVSFQLSYASVLAIALYLESRRADAPQTQPDAGFHWSRVLDWCSSTWTMSLIVTAVTLPLVAVHFHQLPWGSPIANLLLIPLAGVIVPMSLLSAGWLLLTHGEALPVAPILEWWLRLMTDAVSWLAHLPAVNWHVAAPSWLTVLAYYGLMLVLRVEALPTRRTAATCCLAMLLCWWTWPHRTLPPDSVRVTVMDVGQGDALLVELPGGETVLIDAGARHERYDVGATVVGPLLWDRGITRITHAIGTHPQLDHVGGMPWIIRHFPVEHFWGNRMPRREAFYRDLQLALDEHHLIERFPSPGETLVASRPCRLIALSPVRDNDLRAVPESRPASGTELNDASLITRLDCGSYTAVFAADVEAGGLGRLIGNGFAAPATLLKVPHHGARSSLSLPWIHAVSPQVAVISAGPHNPYRHPHPDVLAAYRERGIPLLRTDRDGAVTITASLSRPLFSILTARQLQFEPVPMARTLWQVERRNLHRLWRRWVHLRGGWLS